MLYDPVVLSASHFIYEYCCQKQWLMRTVHPSGDNSWKDTLGTFCEHAEQKSCKDGVLF